MQLNWLITGLKIAAIFGVPAGAIGALCIQNTLKYEFILFMLIRL